MHRKDQRPAGGCVNCGGTVRTRKRDGWVCGACQSAILRAEREGLSELEKRYAWGDR